jgi:serine/threonine protein phosphatase PrpC
VNAHPDDELKLPRLSLVVEPEMDRPAVWELDKLAAAVYSARCPGKTSANEDAAAIVQLDPECAVLVVADGMGGGLVGDRASALAVRSVVHELEAVEAVDDQALRAAILNGFERANREVQELAMGAATTLAVVQVSQGMVRPFHVGDSVVLVTGNRGRIKLQTIAHSPVGYAVEAGVLDAAEAMHHEERHLVSNMVGSPDMRIEVGAPMRLARRDTLLVASDGLADNLHLDEIVELIRKGPLPGAIKALAAVARQRMLAAADADHPSKPDDMTLIALRRRS